MVELKTVETVDTSPFKKLVVTIGELPTSFVESMSYYECLAWLVSYIQNTVIPAVNGNAEATTELQDKFIELNTKFNQLQSYVEHYFDNLDVQQEINNKIDQMASDGYFENLITPIVQSTINELSSEVTTGLAEARNAAYVIKTNNIRKNSYSRYSKVVLPTQIDSVFLNKINIFTNGEKHYTANYNEEDFINTGGSTWYFSPNGNNSNAGDREHPFKSIDNTTYAQISSGDTLILLEGHYPKGAFLANNPTKTYNMIGEGDVWLSSSDLNYEWTQTATNVWKTSRSGIRAIYDITRLKEGITPALTLVNSTDDVASTPNSYFTSGNDVYVHLSDNSEPSNDNIELALGTGYAALNFTPDADGKIYIKNINVISCDRGGFKIDSGEHSINVLIKDCKIYNNNAQGYNEDGFTNLGCNSICENVVIINSKKDGFNYHASGSTQAYGVEINCKVNNMGYGQTIEARLSNNASTAHDDCQVIRVNGEYTYCNGGVIVDIGTSKSAVYGCIVLDSYGRSYDCYTSDTASMWIYDSYFKGSRANTNMLANTNAHMYYNSGTEYDTKGSRVELIN